MSILASTDVESSNDQLRAYIYLEGPRVSIGRTYRYQRVPGAGAARGSINMFSDRSKARLSRYLSSCKANYQYLATLTVGAEWDENGELFKKALDKFLQWFMREQRKRCGDVSRGTQSICWFLEFQKRGAPHIHFFYTTPVPWELCSTKWREALELHAVSFDPNVELAGTKFEKLRAGRSGASSYARKYALKLDQKLVPSNYSNVGRFWGVRGLREIVSCHMLPVEHELAELAIQKLENAMEHACELGLYRRFAWIEGDGAVYFPAKGVNHEQILWVIALIYATGANLLWYGNATYYEDLSVILKE
jgi:hypothetical protein